MVVRADETHLRYSLQYSDHCTEIFAIQGFSPAFERSPTQYAAGIRALRAVASGLKPRPAAPPYSNRLIQTAMPVESDVLFRPRNNEAVAVLRQRRWTSADGRNLRV